jgi:hypothetical protein
MVDTAKCFSLVRGRVMRVTKLDSCGRPVLGPASTVVTEGFIQVAFTANTQDGTSISVTNASGKVCIRDDAPPNFVGYGLQIDLCGVDPTLISILTGQPNVFDSAGLAVGFQVNSDVDLAGTAFALELWSNVPSDVCDVGQTGANYGYTLIPYIKGGILGDFTVQNDAVNFIITGANSKDGNGWDVGPYNVVSESGVAGPLLNPLPSKNHVHVQLTDVPPPVEACGATQLGVRATGANVTSTTAATLTPTNSFAPTSFADTAGKTALVATPSTAWATGKYVLLGDGSKMHWSGTAWVAGVA